MLENVVEYTQNNKITRTTTNYLFFNNNKIKNKKAPQQTKFNVIRFTLTLHTQPTQTKTQY